MKKKILFLIFIISVIYNSKILKAQCGDITLSTQAEVNVFATSGCSSINGTLLISGQDINDLNPIFNAGLTSVSGDVIIADCPSLLSLEGIDGINTIGGTLNIEKNDNLSTLGNFGYSLSSVGVLMRFENCPNIQNFDGYFESLTSIGLGLVIGDLDIAKSIHTFSNLSSCPAINISYNSALQTIPGFPSLTSSSYIEISNNSPALSSINGFTGLTSLVPFSGFGGTLDGDIRISNNMGTFNIGGFNSLGSISGDLEIENNFNIDNISGFSSLTQVNNLFISGNTVMNISGFNSLSTVENDFTYSTNNEGTALRDLDIRSTDLAFNSLQRVGGDLVIFDNVDIFALTGFNNLNSVGGLIINQNPFLSNVGGFANLNNLGTFQVTNNGSLGDCCWIMPLSDIATGTVSISNNAAGCTSLSAIGSGSPTYIGCPSNMTISTNTGQCFGQISITTPNVSDDCGVADYQITISGPGNNSNYSAIPLEPRIYTLNTGIHLYAFRATDDSGNESYCSFNVTVVDQEMPTWDAPVNAVDIVGECGIDDPGTLANANVPTVFDNCGVFSVGIDNISASSVCGGSSAITYTYVATDVNGNQSTEYAVTVHLDDHTAPIISGVPADVTISCHDAFPNIPSPTAADQCDGNLTSSIVAGSSLTVGSCTPGEEAEVYDYVWQVSDGCGNQASENWKVTVISDFSFDLGPDVAVCDVSGYTIDPGVSGQFYQWSTGANTPTLEVTQSGTYSVVITSNNGCCYEDEIVVSFGDAPDASATGGTISCNNSSVQIMGNSTSDGVSYSWVGPGGFTSTEQNPTVNNTGNYTLVVTDALGCESTAQATVTADVEVPDGSANGGTIDCSNPSVTLSASSTTDGVIYTWSGPDGFTSTDQNPIVTAAGIYAVQIMAQNGCSVQVDAEVTEDLTAPVVSAMADQLTCNLVEVQLQVTGSNDIISYAWTGPEGFAADTRDPMISVPGVYNLLVTADNGCTATTEVTVNQNIETPDIMVTGGVLSCNSSQVILQSSSITPDLTYTWSGANGFGSSLPTPTVTDTGSYQLIVTGINGCVAAATAVVSQDTIHPSVSAIGGTIDCNNVSIALQGSSDNPNVIFSWAGPMGFTSSDQNPMVSQSGNYVLQVTAENGCTANSSAIVNIDTSKIDFQLEPGDINCESGTVAISANTIANDAGINWTGPDGFISNSFDIIANLAGQYNAIMIAANGCESDQSITLPMLGFPEVSAMVDTLKCGTDSVQIQVMSNSEIESFQWSGPADFTSNLQNPMVGVAGRYTLVPTTPLGCQDTVLVEVLADTDLPDIAADGGVLDCHNPSVQLSGSSGTQGVTFSWAGPDGFTSSEQNPMIEATGEYVLTVLSGNGCEISRSVEVRIDTLPPMLELSLRNIDCENESITINTKADSTVALYSWTGPGPFSSEEKNPVVTMPGEYRVAATGDNGCATIMVITVDQNLTQPVAMAIGDTLNCTDESVMIQGMADQEDVSYQWTGPGGFTSDVQNPLAAESGTYLLTVTAANTCTGSAKAEVIADSEIPDIEVEGGVIDCDTDSITLSGMTTSAGATVSWIGPGGFTSTENNPVVTILGNYTFSVIATNGCEAKKSATVSEDFTLPDVNLDLGGINCEAGTRTIIGSSSSAGTSLIWSGPNGFNSETGEIMVSDGGLYILEVIGTNGCVAMDSTELPGDFAYSFSFLTTPDTTAEGGSAEIIITGGTTPFTIIWDNGTQGSTTAGLSMGDHIVTIIDGYNCVNIITFTIDGTIDVLDLESSIDSKVYPNPVSDLLTIAWEGNKHEISEISVLDMNGRLVSTQKVSGSKGMVTLNVHELKSGIYLTRLLSDQGMAYRKFVKD